MSIAVGQKVIAAGAILAAVWLGWMIAEGANLVPALLACLALLGCLTQLIRVSLGAMMLGVVLFGYLVGNRGFAQLMPIPAIPILPAELVLGVAGAWVIVQCAFAQRLPFRRDALNVGTSRPAHAVTIGSIDVENIWAGEPGRGGREEAAGAGLSPGPPRAEGDAGGSTWREGTAAEGTGV